jgi:hypothetical protein
VSGVQPLTVARLQALPLHVLLLLLLLLLLLVLMVGLVLVLQAMLEKGRRCVAIEGLRPMLAGPSCCSHACMLHPSGVHVWRCLKRAAC